MMTGDAPTERNSMACAETLTNIGSKLTQQVAIKRRMDFFHERNWRGQTCQPNQFVTENYWIVAGAAVFAPSVANFACSAAICKRCA